MSDMDGYGMRYSGRSVVEGVHFMVDEDGVLHITPEHGEAMVVSCDFYGDVVFHEAVRVVPDAFPESWEARDDA